MSTRLFVGNVAYNLDEQGLTEGFAQLGIVVENVKIAREKETKRPRGFAFIEVDDTVAAKLLTEEIYVAGRTLRIERSERQPGEDRDRRGSGRPAGGGGGGGDRRRGGGGRHRDGDWGGEGGRRDRRERW